MTLQYRTGGIYSYMLLCVKVLIILMAIHKDNEVRSLQGGNHTLICPRKLLFSYTVIITSPVVE